MKHSQGPSTHCQAQQNLIGQLAGPSQVQLLSGRDSSYRIAINTLLVLTTVGPEHTVTSIIAQPSHLWQAQEISSPLYATLSGPSFSRSMASSKNIFRVRSGS